MSNIKERSAAAVIGCLCGDAAAQPIHWIYNLGKLQAILSALEYPEFRFPSANPYYRIDTGKNTCYGDQAMALLESLVRCKGLDVKDYATTQYRYFGPESEYENKLNAAFVIKSGVQKNFPIHGPWRDKVLKDFLAKYATKEEETGSDDMTDMHAVIQVVPVVALYAGQPEMLEKVEEAVSVTMTADEAIVHSLAAARILEYFILNGSNGNVVDDVIKELRDPNRTSPHSLDKAVIGFLEKVKRNRTVPHFNAATKVFKNN
nr:crystallin J1A-like [Lytechinus pictus]